MSIWLLTACSPQHPYLPMLLCLLTRLASESLRVSPAARLLRISLPVFWPPVSACSTFNSLRVLPCVCFIGQAFWRMAHEAGLYVRGAGPDEQVISRWLFHRHAGPDERGQDTSAMKWSWSAWGASPVGRGSRVWPLGIYPWSVSWKHGQAGCTSISTILAWVRHGGARCTSRGKSWERVLQLGILRAEFPGESTVPRAGPPRKAPGPVTGRERKGTVGQSRYRHFLGKEQESWKADLGWLVWTRSPGAERLALVVWYPALGWVGEVNSSLELWVP